MALSHEKDINKVSPANITATSYIPQVRQSAIHMLRNQNHYGVSKGLPEEDYCLFWDIEMPLESVNEEFPNQTCV